MSAISADKLENFTSVIAEDALGESRRIYADIERESRSILGAAEDEALDEMFRYIRAEVGRIKTECGRAVSRRMMEGRRSLYARRGEMGDEVRDEVRRRLEAYVKTPEYLQRLRTLVREALESFAADTVIFLREADKKLAAELWTLKTPYQLEFQTGSFTLGGLMAACPSRGLQIDASFDTTLEELHSRFAELFGLEMKS
jgi:vacuolar-type H+-ATPase subunit E/Vma4